MDDFDSPPGLREDLPAPTSADDEVLVRVRASSVNAVDGSIAVGMLKEMVAHEFPVTLDQAPDALQAHGTEHTRGKRAIRAA